MAFELREGETNEIRFSLDVTKFMHRFFCLRRKGSKIMLSIFNTGTSILSEVYVKKILDLLTKKLGIVFRSDTRSALHPFMVPIIAILE